MTLDEIEDALPWGLHDAILESFSVDWRRRVLSLDVRVIISEHQDWDRRARVDITGS